MTLVKRSLVITIVLLVGLVTATPCLTAWKEFRSSRGFSVMYPGTWFRYRVSPDRLDLLSSKNGHAEAVVIRRGAAEITVKEEPASRSTRLARLIEHYSQGTPPASWIDLAGQQRGSCNRLEEVVWKEPPVPPQDVPAYVRLTDKVYTGLFCKIGNRTVTVMLQNWDGDRRQSTYQQIALRMAKSIRIVH